VGRMSRVRVNPNSFDRAFPPDMIVYLYSILLIESSYHAPVMVCGAQMNIGSSEERGLPAIYDLEPRTHQQIWHDTQETRCRCRLSNHQLVITAIDITITALKTKTQLPQPTLGAMPSVLWNVWDRPKLHDWKSFVQCTHRLIAPAPCARVQRTFNGYYSTCIPTS
jgi:hypothetical protein